MPALYASLKRLEVYHLRNLLEADGIPCFVRNELLSQLAGEVPFTECQLELWLRRPEDQQRAEEVLRDFLRGPLRGSPWRCTCGEQLEAQFTACWQCGCTRPDHPERL
jgi:hypothetical protein